MSHDPLDRLRDANPVSDDALPSAPMAAAEQIMSSRASIGRWPAWAVAAAAALAVTVVGGGWLLWLGRGEGNIVAADPSSTTVPDTTAVTVLDESSSLATAVYLLQDTDTGPVVVPVPRVVTVDPSDPDHATFLEAEATLAALLQPPTADEASAGLWNAIPEGIDGPPLSVSKLTRTGDDPRTVATVFVPHQWVDFGYPTADGLAQIIFTLTRIEGIDAVSFLLDDSRFTGGVVAGSLELIPESEFVDHPFVDEKVTRLTFEGYQALAFVDDPAYGAGIELPLTASGVTNSVGNQIRLTLEVDEQTLWQETVTATCGTLWSECRGEWDWSIWQTTIPDVGYTGNAILIAEAFGSGIEVIDSRATPVVIASSESAAATTIPTGTTTVTLPQAGEVPDELAVYLLMDADATHVTPGPHLVPAAWPTAILSAPLTDQPRQALQWLLQGPLPGWEESAPAITTVIPEGTRLLGLEVADGVATVDLSEEFIRDGSTEALAQVVFTLTRFEEIDGVELLIEGEKIIALLDGQGGVEFMSTDEPYAQDLFEDLLPPIMIESPPYWSIARNVPFVASGTANVFEATVSVALTDNDGLILWEGFTTASCGTGCRGDWTVEIPYEVDHDQMGSLIVWEESARDGSQTNVREHPVWLTATTEPAAAECSGADVAADLPDQSALPEPVAEMRESLFAAARSCDWGALASLLGPDTNTTFGPPIDPIAQWQQEEAEGLRPMYWLAQTLQLPSAVEAYPGAMGRWIWPSVASYEFWETVTEAERQALLEIYTAEDLATFDEWGAFFLWRVGITADGEWAFFVTGD